MPDLSYRQAMLTVARTYLADVLPKTYSPDMTDEEVIDLLENVVETVVNAFDFIDRLRNIGLLPDGEMT